jgi:hypothetical protein
VAHPLVVIVITNERAWWDDRMPVDKPSLEIRTKPSAAGFLYPLTIAFPSWAGAILAVYSVILSRFSSFRIRPK